MLAYTLRRIAQLVPVVLVLTVVERHEGGGARFREIGIPFRRLFYTLEDGSLYPDERVLARLEALGSH